MINLYVGTPGSGKSLHSIQDIKTLSKRGGLVITNFEINKKYLRNNKCGFVMISSEKLLYRPQLLIHKIQLYLKFFPEKRVLVIIDECSDLFDNRQWNMRGRKEWLHFFRLHRHYNAIKKDNIIIDLVTQSEADIDKKLKAYCDSIYYHRKISKFGNVAFIIDAILPIDLFYCSIHTNNKMVKMRTGGFWLFGRKSLYKIYDTTADFN